MMQNVEETSVESSSHKSSFNFDMSEEIYDLLLSNILTSYSENEELLIKFNNLEEDKANEIKANTFKETSVFEPIIIVNPKKGHKKARLCFVEEMEKLQKMEIDMQFLEQIRDVNIAKIWMQSSKYKFCSFFFYIIFI